MLHKLKKSEHLQAKDEKPADHLTLPHGYSLMAVQQKLGLFARPAEQDKPERHAYLKGKPMGFI